LSGERAGTEVALSAEPGGKLKPDFLSHVTQSLQFLLSGVLIEDGFNLFKKAPKVIVGSAFPTSSSDFHLTFLGHELVERDSASFRCEGPEGTSLVLRNPSRIRIDYALTANLAGAQSRLDSWDRLVSYFFDHPSIPPFVPKSLEAIPGLYERLTQESATLLLHAAKAESLGGPHSEIFRASLQYSALYHSGAVMTREALVKQRVIDYRNRERSVP
jgi:hypothetical protein